MKRVKCGHCDGRGYRFDDAEVGVELRKLRRKAKLSGQAVADWMGVGQQYLSKLERGRAQWSDERVSQFRQAVQKLGE
jgi:transcriptional regulator with XRE-family HTH domain